MIKTNICVSILLLLLIQLIVGCGGRRGPFVEFGGGMAPVVAHEEWTARTYGDAAFSAQPLINQTHHDTIVPTISLAGNLKYGWGLTEQLLISPSFQFGSKLSTMGIGITVFQKKTAPSLFFDITLPGSLYILPVPSSLTAIGTGASVGVGYEFKKNWTVRGNFSLGTHDFNVTDQDLGEGILGLFGILPSYTAYDGRTTGASLAFTVNYIWY